MEEYTREFEFLKLKCDAKEKTSQTIAYYLGGLKKSIVDVIRLQPYWTLGDVIKLAKTVEKQQKEVQKPATTSFKRPSFSNLGSASSSSNKVEVSMSKLAYQKNEVKASNIDVASRRRCYKCGGIGHI